MDKVDDLQIFDECRQSCQQVEVPTADECEALDAMRKIKDRVREIKKRISEISFSNGNKESGELMTLEAEMTGLKTQWHEWEEKKERAAKERMILLGHEEAE